MLRNICKHRKLHFSTIKRPTEWQTHTKPHGFNTNTKTFQLLLGSPKMCKQKPKKQCVSDKIHRTTCCYFIRLMRNWASYIWRAQCLNDADWRYKFIIFRNQNRKESNEGTPKWTQINWSFDILICKFVGFGAFGPGILWNSAWSS